MRQMILVGFLHADIGRRDDAAFKAEAAHCGRDPEQVKITQLINTVAAATKAEAEDK